MRLRARAVAAHGRAEKNDPREAFLGGASPERTADLLFRRSCLHAAKGVLRECTAARRLALVLLGLLLGAVPGLQAQQPPRQAGEDLGRGLVAVPNGEGGVFVSWRLLRRDPACGTFNLYRMGRDGPVRLNDAPLTATHFTDEDGTSDAAYVVRPVEDGAEGPASAPSERPSVYTVGPGGAPYRSVPLQTPAGYTPNDASIGDLDGDGAYEIVLHQAGTARDNSQSGFTDPPIFEAYELDGTRLWRIDLGINIREGAHYTPFIVYDFDGDGAAEVAMKTADGTTDGTGVVIGDADADHRNDDGYILQGPEYLTMFDGKTGAALATTDYVPPRHPETDVPTPAQIDAIWGDGYGNRVDRFLGGVAYLDGAHPSLVMTRGYYTRMVAAAWDWDGEAFAHRWTFDSAAPGNEAYRGEGNHSLSVADVDGDGKDEILMGAAAIDDDGTGLYATGIGHGDALHVSDLDPSRPGLELFHIQEPVGEAGANFRDADSGEVLWQKPTVRGGEGPGRGLAANVDPRHRGAESWVFGGGISGLFDVDGHAIASDAPGSANFAIWWDGDLQRELLDRNRIDNWNWEEERLERVLTARGSASNNGTKATPALQADLFGDWREEVIWRAEDNQSLRIYTTTTPTPHRFVTLMQDPVYRLGIAWQNVGYNQPPHTSFYIGDDMDEPPATGRPPDAGP